MYKARRRFRPKFLENNNSSKIAEDLKKSATHITLDLGYLRGGLIMLGSAITECVMTSSTMTITGAANEAIAVCSTKGFFLGDLQESVADSWSASN